MEIEAGAYVVSTAVAVGATLIGIVVAISRGGSRGNRLGFSRKLLVAVLVVVSRGGGGAGRCVTSKFSRFVVSYVLGLTEKCAEMIPVLVVAAFAAEVVSLDSDPERHRVGNNVEELSTLNCVVDVPISCLAFQNYALELDDRVQSIIFRLKMQELVVSVHSKEKTFPLKAASKVGPE